jgi:RNA polymerase primary sigma factor
MREYFSDVSKTPLLTREQEIEVFKRIADGDPEAREVAIKANLRLVIRLSAKYKESGVGREDLISEGNLGLMRAIDAYDLSLGTRFSTFAAAWIRQSMRRIVLSSGKPIKLPAYVVTLLAKWERAKRLLAEIIGREPTHREIAAYLDFSQEKEETVRMALETSNASYEEIEPQ